MEKLNQEDNRFVYTTVQQVLDDSSTTNGGSDKTTMDEPKHLQTKMSDIFDMNAYSGTSEMDKPTITFEGPQDVSILDRGSTTTLDSFTINNDKEDIKPNKDSKKITIKNKKQSGLPKGFKITQNNKKDRRKSSRYGNGIHDIDSAMDKELNSFVKQLNKLNKKHKRKSVNVSSSVEKVVDSKEGVVDSKEGLKEALESLSLLNSYVDKLNALIEIKMTYRNTVKYSGKKLYSKNLTHITNDFVNFLYLSNKTFFREISKLNLITIPDQNEQDENKSVNTELSEINKQYGSFCKDIVVDDNNKYSSLKLFIQSKCFEKSSQGLIEFGEKELFELKEEVDNVLKTDMNYLTAPSLDCKKFIRFIVTVTKFPIEDEYKAFILNKVLKLDSEIASHFGEKLQVYFKDINKSLGEKIIDKLTNYNVFIQGISNQITAGLNDKDVKAKYELFKHYYHVAKLFKTKKDFAGYFCVLLEFMSYDVKQELLSIEDKAKKKKIKEIYEELEYIFSPMGRYKNYREKYGEDSLQPLPLFSGNITLMFEGNEGNNRAQLIKNESRKNLHLLNKQDV